MEIKAQLKGSYLLLNVFLSVALVVAPFLDEQPYCALRYRRLCQGKGRHVGCQYPYSGPGVACRNYTQIKFTAELRHFVINYINRRRQRIAAGTERVKGGALVPKPRVMMMVAWDRELALLAQRLADQCSFIHDDCRATVRYPYSGQAVGEVRWRGGGGAPDAAGARRAGRAGGARGGGGGGGGERRRVTPDQLVAPFRLANRGAAWGHFSQLAVWALAAAGCGAARHGSPRRLLLVCDFSHTNMLGQSTLLAGAPAPCPPRYARRPRSPYPLLCAPIRIPDRSVNADEVEYGSYGDDAGDTTTFLYDEGDDTISTVATSRTTRAGDTVSRALRRKYKNSTKPHVVAKLDRELVMKDAALTNTESEYRHGWRTRTYFSDIREKHERESMSKARFKINVHESNYRTFEEAFTTETLRRKWKQTRQRPRRPGADALLIKPVAKILRHSSAAAISLDREDLEQLFRDTGFHKHWKKP